MTTTQARKDAHELMTLHLGANHGWTFKFDNAKRRLGQCCYTTRTIKLSHPLTLANDAATMRNTILHEIAHAIAGHAAGHGPAWQAVATRIGARPERCASAQNIVQAAAPYSLVCPTCGTTQGRHKRVPQGTKYLCLPCKRAGRQSIMDLVVNR